MESFCLSEQELLYLSEQLLKCQKTIRKPTYADKQELEKLLVLSKLVNQ